VDQTLAELITPTLDGLMMVLTVKPWPFLPPSPSLRRPEIYADKHVVTQRCPRAFSSLFYPQSAICPLILYPLVVIHKSLCQVLKPEDGSRGPKCAMGYHEKKSRAVRPCLSVVYRKLPITFSGSSTHAAGWCIGSAVNEVVSPMLCAVWPGVGKGLGQDT
jgi:hypothetical protein